MNTHSFSSSSERSLLESLVATVSASFRRSSKNESIAALAASLASELRSEAGVAELVLNIAPLAKGKRDAALMEAARFFRGDWNTFGIADSLRRLTRPELFQAVVRELQVQTEFTESVRFSTPRSLLTQVA